MFGQVLSDIAKMASTRKGNKEDGLIINSSAEKTQSENCSPELSSEGEQIVIVHTENDIDNFRFPATLSNFEGFSDTMGGVSEVGGAIPSFNDKFSSSAQQSRSQREVNNNTSGMPDPFYQMLIQQQLLMQNMINRQCAQTLENQNEEDDVLVETESVDVESSLDKLCEEAKPQVTVTTEDTDTGSNDNEDVLLSLK